VLPKHQGNSLDFTSVLRPAPAQLQEFREEHSTGAEVQPPQRHFTPHDMTFEWWLKLNMLYILANLMEFDRDY